MEKLGYIITIIFGLISLINSSKVEITEDDIIRLETDLNEAAKYMEGEVKDENASICIGATRSGKSTLINYIIGNKLEAVSRVKGLAITIEKADNKSVGPDIGSGSTSKTKIPKKWTSKNLPHLAIWDAPGFDDNRGVRQDITNAYYLYELLENVKSLKIVLVVDINNILSDDVKPFVSVLKSVEDLLGNKMRYYFKSITIIFTKVPDNLNGFPVDMKLIGNILSYKFLSDNKMNLSQITKDFIKFLVENNDRFAFFKRPTEIGFLTSVVDVNIFSAINNSTSLPKNQLQSLSPSISDSSKLSLYILKNKLNQTSAFNDFEKGVSDIIEAKLRVSSENKYEIETFKTELISFKNKLSNAYSNENDFFKKIEILQKIDDDIKKKIEEHKILQKIRLIKFVDKLLNFSEGDGLTANLNRILFSSIDKVNIRISSIDLQLGLITRQEYDDRIRALEEEHSKQLAAINRLIEKIKNQNNERDGFWNSLIDGARLIVDGVGRVITLLIPKQPLFPQFPPSHNMYTG